MVWRRLFLLISFHYEKAAKRFTRFRFNDFVDVHFSGQQNIKKLMKLVEILRSISDAKYPSSTSYESFKEI